MQLPVLSARDAVIADRHAVSPGQVPLSIGNRYPLFITSVPSPRFGLNRLDGIVPMPRSGVCDHDKRITDFSATAAYERHVMDATGGASGRSPDQAYGSSDIWTFGIQSAF